MAEERKKDVRHSARQGAWSTRQKEQPKPLPKKGRGAVCAQFRACGKPGCRCAKGTLHGPYYALFWRERGRLRKRYLRLAEVETVRYQCAARRKREASHRRLWQLWRHEYGEYVALLRQVDRL